MEIGEMLGDSFEYTKDGLVGEWIKWFLLVICYIIFPLMGGYTVRIFRGMKPAPELEDWVGLFVDGIKLLIIEIIYAIPVLIVMFVLVGGSAAAIATGDETAIAAALGAATLGILAVIILGIIISLISLIGIIRFARTESMGEAFNFGAILNTISQIGWVNYIIALIVLWVVMVIISVIVSILTAIPILGWLIYLFVLPAVVIFSARYMTLLYESAGSTV